MLGLRKTASADEAEDRVDAAVVEQHRWLRLEQHGGVLGGVDEIAAVQPGILGAVEHCVRRVGQACLRAVGDVAPGTVSVAPCTCTNRLAEASAPRLAATSSAESVGCEA